MVDAKPSDAKEAEPLLTCDCPKKEKKTASELEEIHVTSDKGSAVFRYCRGNTTCMRAVNAAIWK